MVGGDEELCVSRSAANTLAPEKVGSIGSNLVSIAACTPLTIINVCASVISEGSLATDSCALFFFLEDEDAVRAPLPTGEKCLADEGLLGEPYALETLTSSSGISSVSPDTDMNFAATTLNTSM